MVKKSGHTDPIVPIHLGREQGKAVTGGASTTRLWLKEPESQVKDGTVVAARLCSCTDVCLAVIEDHGDQ
jgi:hypothetical protein